MLHDQYTGFRQIYNIGAAAACALCVRSKLSRFGVANNLLGWNSFRVQLECQLIQPRPNLYDKLKVGGRFWRNFPKLYDK